MKIFSQVLIFLLLTIAVKAFAADDCLTVKSRTQADFSGGLNQQNIDRANAHVVEFLKAKVCPDITKLSADATALGKIDSVDVTAQIQQVKAKLEELEGESIGWAARAENICVLSAFDAQKNASCAQHVLSGLRDEEDWAKENNLDIAHLGADIATLAQQLAAHGHTTTGLAASSGPTDLVLTDEAINTVKGSAVTEEQKKEVKEGFEKSEYGRIYSQDHWMGSFHLGASFMPEYNSEGENEGFTETNAFGSFMVDGRKEILSEKFSWVRYWAIHMGAAVDMFSAHVVNCDPPKATSAAEGSSEEGPGVEVAAVDEVECENVNLQDLDFNDIAHTVNASAYIWGHVAPDFLSEGTEIGLGLKATAQNRDKLGQGDDSLNEIYSLGARIVYNEYIYDLLDGKRKYQNGMPRFFLEASIADYETYAGLPDYDDYRYVFRSAYRIADKTPTYVGVLINGGKGPDEIAITLSYGLKLDRIVKMF